MNSDKKILFTANDPGGANAILPVVQMLLSRGDTCEGFLTGPAREIFKRAGVPFQNAEVMEDPLINSFVDMYAPDLLLSGRSVDATLDNRLLAFLLHRGVPSVYVLDFWNYYGHRFTEAREDDALLPTRVCVIDERMRGDMVEAGIPFDRLVVTGNPYFDHFTKGITCDHEDSLLGIFLSQPIRRDSQLEGSLNRGFNEYEVLEDVIKTLPANMHLSIRLHPREEKSKFDLYLNDRVTIDNETTLEKALSKAGLVIGMFSPVLMQAAFASKPTISYQPGMTGVDSLPTNALGITKEAKNKTELVDLFSAYANGKFPRPTSRIETLWPKGATLRVVAIIDQLTK